MELIASKENLDLPGILKKQLTNPLEVMINQVKAIDRTSLNMRKELKD